MRRKKRVTSKTRKKVSEKTNFFRYSAYDQIHD